MYILNVGHMQNKFLMLMVQFSKLLWGIRGHI
jgi:hypothetical protein